VNILTGRTSHTTHTHAHTHTHMHRHMHTYTHMHTHIPTLALEHVQATLEAKQRRKEIIKQANEERRAQAALQQQQGGGSDVGGRGLVGFCDDKESSMTSDKGTILAQPLTVSTAPPAQVMQQAQERNALDGMQHQQLQLPQQQYQAPTQQQQQQQQDLQKFSPMHFQQLQQRQLQQGQTMFHPSGTAGVFAERRVQYGCKLVCDG